MASRLNALVKSFIFQRPKMGTYDASTHPDSLLHVPGVDRETLRENGLFTHAYLFLHIAATHLVIYAHPNAVDIGMLYDELYHLSQHAQVNVLGFEYSGYGLTHREITEATIHDDMLAAYWFTRRYLAVPPGRIILCGRSIGTAPAAKLCASLPPADTPSLLVLQCPFTALSECAEQFSNDAVTLANYLGFNWFRTSDIIADVRCPVVLHHGSHDTVVPITHSYALRQKRDTAAHPCVTYFYQEDGKGHNNLSRSLLIKILQEKVDSEGLSPLHTVWPSSLVAHPPVHSLLFPAEYRKGPLALVHQHWQRHYNLQRFLLSHNSLYALLTASVCSFAMKVAYRWQVYSEVVKRNARNASASLPPSPLHGVTGGNTVTKGGDGHSPGSFSSSSWPGNGGEAVVHRHGANSGRQRGYRTPTEDRRCTKEDFIARCIACWGSPLGVHVPIAGLSQSADVVVFGSSVPPGKCESFDVGWQFSLRPPRPMVTVAELPMTSELLRAVQKVVSSAPELLTERSDSDDERRRRRLPHNTGSDGSKTPGNLSVASSSSVRHTDDEGGSSHNSRELGGESTLEPPSPQSPPSPSALRTLPAFIHPDLVSAVQTECERIAGFMSDEDLADLQTLFTDFEVSCEERLSPKTRAVAGRAFEEESFDDLMEWLRPYLEQPDAMEAFAKEVPWDYYLFKARVLSSRQHLEVDMDWLQCVRAMEEARAVQSVYQFFCKYWLHRAKAATDV